ncbi:CSS-motif domain-containing protein [Psychromonas sp. MME2]|uniref:CSS-motif domain-containing protein n=1 Tax=Psychromonas sp. MME2 TaxID=3231033 RepID=UPI00339C3436
MFITTSSPLHKSIIPSPMLRCSLAAIFALSVLAAILLFLLQQTKNTLQDVSNSMANDALWHIDEMATNTHATLDHLSEYSDRSCSEVKEQLENQLITGIYLHSIHLFKNNTIYCSSVYRAIGFPVAGKEYYSNGEMLLLTSKKLNNNIPLLVHRRDIEQTGILSLIDGRYLRLALSVQEEKGFIALQVGETWMTETDQTADGPLPKLTFVSKIKSQQFPLQSSPVFMMKFYGNNCGKIMAYY